MKKVWLTEPDRKHWVDEHTGYDCLIVRNNYTGALCGYVGVPVTHRCYGDNYSNDRLYSINVHGGLTYSGRCEGHICHDPKHDKVANEHVWWFGFDCTHAFDYAPKMAEHYPAIAGSGEYRDMEYVTTQCTLLAAQLQQEA